jgi:hypothetical protein
MFLSSLLINHTEGALIYKKHIRPRRRSGHANISRLPQQVLVYKQPLYEYTNAVAVMQPYYLSTLVMPCS